MTGPPLLNLYAACGRNQNGKSEILNPKSQFRNLKQIRNPKPPLPAKRPRAGPKQILTSSMPLRPPFSLPPFFPFSHFSVLRISDSVPNMRARCAHPTRETFTPLRNSVSFANLMLAMS